MGAVDGTRRGPRRRDLPHDIFGISAGERRDAADGLHHRHRLPQRRSEQDLLRRQELRSTSRSTISTAPADVRSTASAVRPPAPSVEATPVSQGVWLLHGAGGANSILFEFADQPRQLRPAKAEYFIATADGERHTIPQPGKSQPRCRRGRCNWPSSWCSDVERIRERSGPMSLAIAVLAALSFEASAAAQRGGPPGPPQTPKAAAPSTSRVNGSQSSARTGAIE